MTDQTNPADGSSSAKIIRRVANSNEIAARKAFLDYAEDYAEDYADMGTDEKDGTEDLDMCLDCGRLSCVCSQTLARDDISFGD
jgi:hypothetical protein